MKKNEYFGLWKRENSDSYSGKANINGEEYWVNLYTNNSENPKAPVFNVHFKPVEQKAPW